jgi:hypothetical protein
MALAMTSRSTGFLRKRVQRKGLSFGGESPEARMTGINASAGYNFSLSQSVIPSMRGMFQSVTTRSGMQ